MNGKHPLRSAFMVPVLFVALGMTSIPSEVFSIDRHSAGPGKSGTDHLLIYPDYAQSAIIVLFTVKNGKVGKSFHSEAELFENPEILMDGYVAGIVAFSEAEQDIYVNDIRLRQVSRKKDGAIVFNHYGKLQPEEIFILDMADHKDSAETAINRYFEDDFVRGYSFFPVIPGDAISPDNRFTIDMWKNGTKLEVSVYQNGYRNFPREEGLQNKEACQIRYLGDGFDSLKQKVPDFQERIDAITEGVAEVEKAFRTRLVRKVNIVDCDGIHNALTRAGYDDIWFFIETFQKETVSELKTIARHEVLHLLVDKYDFTKSIRIREIFAELKGYGELSFERFFLVTQGKIKNRSRSKENRHHLFDFVNEKNFLPGSKGGHSQDNLDEFCTSFLHSLMYQELIGKNLNRPLEIGSGRSSVRLSTDEQSEILKIYRSMIESLTAEIGSNEGEYIANYMKTALSRLEDLMESFTTFAKIDSIR